MKRKWQSFVQMVRDIDFGVKGSILIVVALVVYFVFIADEQANPCESYTAGLVTDGTSCKAPLKLEKTTTPKSQLI
jgi:hypothetical protein